MLDVFVYVTKVGTQNVIRRATEARVATSTTLINEHISRTDTTDAYGPASRRYWATTHARQPEGTPVAPPNSVTFDQLQSIDSQQSEIDTAATARLQEPDFVSVGCRINGGKVTLQLNLEDIRNGLGLPAYNLCPPYRPPVDETDPVVNMADVDHESDDMDNEASEIVDQLL